MKSALTSMVSLRGGRTAELARTNQQLLAEVSERKRAQETLRNSEERYRCLVELCPDTIFSACQGRVAFINPAGLKLFGASRPDQIVGKPVLELIHPDWRAVVVRRMETVLSPGESHPAVAEQFLRLDGTAVDVEVAAAPFVLEGKPGALVIARDIAERKRAEEALRASRDNLSAIFNTVNVAIFIFEPNGKILAVNDKVLDLYQVDREQALKLSLKEYSERPNASDAPPAIWEKVLAGETHSLEWAVRRPRDGSVFPVEVFLRKVTWAGRQAIMAAAYDLTEKKSLEKQLLRSQRLESIGTLAAGIAHDLNNILAPIMMSAELLQRGKPGREESEILANIQASAQRGANIVKQVLTFARGIEGQRSTLQPEHLVREMHRIAQETFPKNITLQASVPRDLWTVTGDATQLHQVLINLCVNARDAMPEGGTLRLSAKNVQVAKAAASLFADGKTGPHVLLEVADTGQGIPPAIIEKIFDPFFTTKEQNKGTGLGLSTVLGIVRSHGGFVDVASEPGRGSTFKVYLPATPGEDTPRVIGVHPAPPAGQGECVLVVDDEVNIRSVTERTLIKHGYEVLVAANGKEALDLVARHAETLKAVITDIMMPVMDGVAVVCALKQSHQRIPVIACTGWGQEGIQAKLRDLGVTSFLEKPYPSETLLKVLRQQLKSSRKAAPAS
jgi:PAS domain S-box-containing protein